MNNEKTFHAVGFILFMSGMAEKFEEMNKAVAVILIFFTSLWLLFYGFLALSFIFLISL